MTQVHIVGAAGYAAAEAARLLRRHPAFRIATLESRSTAGEPLADHYPFWRDEERVFDPAGSALEAARDGDAVILAMRSGEARELAQQLLARGARVVDLSDEFRLVQHAQVAGQSAVYGFTERYRHQIARARVVANPGCYPTATLLALWPLRDVAGEIGQIVVDAKSGITGAGRTPATGSLFAEVDENVRVYGLDGHRHEAEIVQELAASNITAPLVFTPQVVPLRRGMLACAYALFDRTPDEDAVAAAYRHDYGGSPFVRIVEGRRAPSLLAVAGTNDAELHLSVRGNVVRAIVAIDNLGKGAAGQAVQNLNVMYGLAEETALDDLAVAS